jgi:hypothetical protein
MRRNSAFLPGLLAFLVFSPWAFAQQADPSARSAAVALFDQAEQLMAAGQYARACPKYAESYRNDPQLGAVLHLADCLEKNGQFASAYGSFREAAELAQRRNDERVAVATERAKALELRMNRLTIDVAQATRVPGLQVFRDDLPLAEGSWGIGIPVDPGEHVIEARAEGYVPYRTTLNITGEGRQERVQLDALVAQRAKPTNKPKTDISRDPIIDKGTSDPGSTQRLIGLIVVGAGVVAVGVGVGFEFRKSSKLSDRDAICPSSVNCEAGSQARIDQLTSSARSAHTASVVSFIGGGAALAAGAALFFTAPKASPSKRTSFRILPVLGPGSAGVFVTRTFF